MRKDKQKVLDEVWTDQRIAEFLQLEPADQTNPDFYRLHKAYQSMRLEDFQKFLTLFTRAGLDLNAQDPDGRTALSYIQQHRSSADYATVLRAAGAN